MRETDGHGKEIMTVLNFHKLSQTISRFPSSDALNIHYKCIPNENKEHISNSNNKILHTRCTIPPLMDVKHRASHIG